MDTGDIYYWDEAQQFYVLEEIEPEVIVEYVAVEAGTDDAEPSDIENTVSDLEVQVILLEDEIASLQDEIALLSAYDASSSYNLGTTNQTIFEGLVSKVPYGEHYVYWRDSQYSYKFAYGDFSLVGSMFTGAGQVTIITYDTPSGNNNNGHTWSVATDSSFSLDAGNRLVYSDLGNYPGLGERRSQEYVALTAYSVFGAVLFALLDRLRRACIR